MQTTTEAPAKTTVPTVPAERLERIEVAPKRLSQSKIERKASTSGKTRANVVPRAWTMGGNVD